MKINDIWNEFLELRKSPACIIFSLMGLLDLIIFLMILISFIIDIFNIYPNQIFLFMEFSGATFMLSFAYMSLRIPGFLYYMAILIGLFIIEKIFKFKIKTVCIDKNKIYLKFWLIGFFTAIVVSILIPSILKYIHATLGKGI